jgi:hypothetical protein
MVRLGLVGQGSVGYGKARIAVYRLPLRGAVGPGSAGCGAAGMARHGWARFGGVGHGEASRGSARRGRVWLGVVRRGKAGTYQCQRVDNQKRYGIRHARSFGSVTGASVLGVRRRSVSTCATLTISDLDCSARMNIPTSEHCAAAAMCSEQTGDTRA